MPHFVFLKQENHKNNKKTLLTKESVRNQKRSNLKEVILPEPTEERRKCVNGNKSDFMQLS